MNLLSRKCPNVQDAKTDSDNVSTLMDDDDEEGEELSYICPHCPNVQEDCVSNIIFFLLEEKEEVDGHKTITTHLRSATGNTLLGFQQLNPWFWCNNKPSHDPDRYERIQFDFPSLVNIGH